MEITDQRVCGQMIFDVKGLKAAVADLPDDMPVELCGDNGEIIVNELTTKAEDGEIFDYTNWVEIDHG